MTNGRRSGWLAAAVLMPLVAPARMAAQVPAQPAPQQESASRVRSGFLVKPDTVTVGDPFTLIVTVVVPRGARVDWPTIADSTAVVAMRAPTVIVEEATGGATRTERAEYQLAAWDVGTLPIGLPNATVRDGATVVRVPLAAARVFVRTVLPIDTAKHVPQPARDLFLREVPWWERWWLAALIAALIAGLWWLWRRRRTNTVGASRLLLDPFARALRDFDQLEALKLADAGEHGRSVALAVDIVRDYLQARAPLAALSLTSAEVRTLCADDTRIPHDRLWTLLSDADGIKFAGRSVSTARATELLAEARAVTVAIEDADVAQRAAAAAARAAAVVAETAARQAADDEARQQSRRPKAGVS